MPEWLLMLIKFGTTELPRVLKRHLSRTIVVTIISTLTLQWLLIGPFGSDYLRNNFLSAILTNDELLRRYGAFKPSDTAILDNWSENTKQPSYTDDIGKVPTAIQLARYQAQRAQPPFQPLGSTVTISSPDCKNERPDFGAIYMNLESSSLRNAGWKVGQTVRLTSQDGRGEPVIATISSPRFDMPNDIQFHLNKVQYQMLRQFDPSSRVMISSSTSKIHQIADDNIPTIGHQPCPNG